MTLKLRCNVLPLFLSAAIALGPVALAGGAVLATAGVAEAKGDGKNGSNKLLRNVLRDFEEARRDFNRKMGGTPQRRAPETTPRASAPSGAVVRRETGLVSTSPRPELRPGTVLAAGEGSAAERVNDGPQSEAELRQEMALRDAVEAGQLAPEIAQVIRAGSFPTMAGLEERTAGLGNGWLPGQAEFALSAGQVVCSDGGAGGCAKVTDDPSLADVRAEIDEIEAQAEAVLAVAKLPELVAAMAAVSDEAARGAAETADARDYPVARGEELPPIDILLENRAD